MNVMSLLLQGSRMGREGYTFKENTCHWVLIFKLLYEVLESHWLAGVR